MKPRLGSGLVVQQQHGQIRRATRSSCTSEVSDRKGKEGKIPTSRGRELWGLDHCRITQDRIYEAIVDSRAFGVGRVVVDLISTCAHQTDQFKTLEGQ